MTGKICCLFLSSSFSHSSFLYTYADNGGAMTPLRSQLFYLPRRTRSVRAPEGSGITMVFLIFLQRAAARCDHAFAFWFPVARLVSADQALHNISLDSAAFISRAAAAPTEQVQSVRLRSAILFFSSRFRHAADPPAVLSLLFHFPPSYLS